MRTQWSVVLVVVALSFIGRTAQAQPVSLSVAEASGGVGGTTTVPIVVSQPRGLGAVQVELVYDPAVLEVVGAEAGSLFSGLVDYNTTRPGTLVVAMAGNEGVQSGGELLQVSFRVLHEGQSALALRSARVWEQETSLELPVEVNNGSFSAGAGFAFPTRLVALLVVVILLFVAIKIARPKRRPA